METQNKLILSINFFAKVLTSNLVYIFINWVLLLFCVMKILADLINIRAV